MQFDSIIDFIAKPFHYEIPETLGFYFDLSDATSTLGNPVSQERHIVNNHQVDYKNMIQFHITLSESFSSIQGVKWAAVSAIQSCYYLNFGAHQIDFDERSLTIRFVTFGSSMFITGSVTISGNHYEALYQQYQIFRCGFP